MRELEEALKARGEWPQSPELDDLRSHVVRDQDEICTLKQQIMEKDTRVRYRGCAADCAVCVSEGVWAECAACVSEGVQAECAVCVSEGVRAECAVCVSEDVWAECVVCLCEWGVCID